jgi:hypothetical protein
MVASPNETNPRTVPANSVRLYTSRQEDCDFEDKATRYILIDAARRLLSKYYFRPIQQAENKIFDSARKRVFHWRTHFCRKLSSSATAVSNGLRHGGFSMCGKSFKRAPLNASCNPRHRHKVSSVGTRTVYNGSNGPIPTIQRVLQEAINFEDYR